MYAIPGIYLVSVSFILVEEREREKMNANHHKFVIYNCTIHVHLLGFRVGEGTMESPPPRI